MIGADNERSNLEIIRLILKLMGHLETEYDLVPDRPGHDRRYAIDATKLRNQLGWHPQHTDFERELEKIIEFYQTAR